MELTRTVFKVIELLRQNEVPVCIVEELALNYYNVPRVINVSVPSFMSSSRIDLSCSRMLNSALPKRI